MVLDADSGFVVTSSSIRRYSYESIYACTGGRKDVFEKVSDDGI